MALKKRTGTSNGGGTGLSRGHKSNKIQRLQAPDLSYTPRQKEVATERVGKSKRAAASKAEEIIHQAANAILKENSVLHHDVHTANSLPIRQIKQNNTTGRGLRLKLTDRELTRDASPPPHLLSLNLKRSSAVKPVHPVDFPGTATFLDSISNDIGKIFYTLLQQEDVQTELPDLYQPNLYADIDQDFEDGVPEIMNEWTPEKLFHLYLFAYAQNEPNICDLVADTWIHEFQIAAPRIWKENKTEYGREMKDKPLVSLGYMYLDNKKITAFDPERIQELYLHTRSSCGARLLWADAMALCGSKLENLLDTPETSQHVWHHDLIWNIMRTSLRLTRARLTLKIEERDADSWCARYHEHGKWSKPCYRVLAAEQANEKKQARYNSEVTVENNQRVAGNGGLDMRNGRVGEANWYNHGYAKGGDERIGEEAMGRRVSFMAGDDGGLDEAMFMAVWDENDSGDEA